MARITDDLVQAIIDGHPECEPGDCDMKDLALEVKRLRAVEKAARTVRERMPYQEVGHGRFHDLGLAAMDDALDALDAAKEPTS